MLLESVGSAAKSAEELLNIIIDKKISFEGSFRIEDHFTGMWAFIFQGPILVIVVLSVPPRLPYL